MKDLRSLLPTTFFNPVSYLGGAVSVVSFILILFLFTVEMLGVPMQPYVGIITFVVLPGIMLLGIAVSLYGMRREKRRRLRTGSETAVFPTLDLNDPVQRTRFTFASILVFILLLGTAFGSYQVYHFTESVTFCGQICHQVMKPEFVAYSNSPHSRVTCADCHVGSGADWYVKSKLSGAYQIYSVIFKKYSQPIPTPVHSLRPAQGTCEQCHYPQHFHNDIQVNKTYYMKDEANTPWSVSLLMKISGGRSESGPTSGIHWHVNRDHAVTYTAVDSQRQNIPVVRVRYPDASEDEFVTTDEFDASALAAGETRTMDCIDCHNRPTHIYRSPEETINAEMSHGTITPTLPSVRLTVSEALTQEYADDEAAMQGIASYITDFYRLRHPALFASRRAEIDSAVSVAKRIYERNFFPYMRVSWKRYPNNIGHFNNLGCFRCHDNKHVSKKTGKVLSNDCNTCHTILSQGTSLASNISPKGLEFLHPVDIGDAWKTMNCIDCHTGQ